LGEQNVLQRKVHDEIARFEETMRELDMLKNASRDLKNYRKMIHVKEND
jgi:hypothetical protein